MRRGFRDAVARLAACKKGKGQSLSMGVLYWAMYWTMAWSTGMGYRSEQSPAER